jgi:pimeloyl-ACP methyl ester carboxylesterase
LIEPRIAYATSRGLKVAYSVVGDAPLDLVVIPGFVSHLEVALEFPPIQRAIRRLTRFARVISFDKPGTGLSDPVEGAPTLEERMEDLSAVLHAARVERAALFGMSEGAPLSALFAATHRERVIALVMYGSYAKGSWAEDYPWAPTAEQAAAGQELIEDGWGQGIWLDALAPSFARDPALVRWWARYERQAASPAMARAISRLATAVDIRHVLPAVAVPTLVLHRTGDMSWPMDGARYVAARVPGAKFVELEGDDHFPFAGDVDALLDEVESFLTGAAPVRDPDRRLLTVLFTDIVASTQRAAELGDRRWRTLLERHDELVGAEVARYGGRVVKALGDGFLATFEGPARAIQCARAGRKDRRDRHPDSSRPPHRRVRADRRRHRRHVRASRRSRLRPGPCGRGARLTHRQGPRRRFGHRILGAWPPRAEGHPGHVGSIFGDGDVPMTGAAVASDLVSPPVTQRPTGRLCRTAQPDGRTQTVALVDERTRPTPDERWRARRCDRPARRATRRGRVPASGNVGTASLRRSPPPMTYPRPCAAPIPSRDRRGRPGGS